MMSPWSTLAKWWHSLLGQNVPAEANCCSSAIFGPLLAGSVLHASYQLPKGRLPDPGGVGYALPPPHRPQSHKPLARLQVPLLLVEFVKLIRAFLPVYGLHYYATHHVLPLLPYAYPAPLILMGHYHTDLV